MHALIFVDNTQATYGPHAVDIDLADPGSLKRWLVDPSATLFVCRDGSQAVRFFHGDGSGYGAWHVMTEPKPREEWKGSFQQAWNLAMMMGYAIGRDHEREVQGLPLLRRVAPVDVSIAWDGYRRAWYESPHPTPDMSLQEAYAIVQAGGELPSPA